MRERISVMLIDDNPVFLRATTQFLEAHDDVQVVGASSKGEEALNQIKKLNPQAVLIDLAMPGLSGLAAIPRLRYIMPDLGIIALTVMNSPGFRDAALDAGADLFIPKATMRTALLPAIRQVAQGKAAQQKPSVEEVGTEAPRVLIMEDDPDLLRLYSKALSKVGCDVFASDTVEKSRHLIAKERFDVLLCDIRMGSAKGTDLLQEYAEELATSGAQVVMVSGQAHYRDVCAELGADFFLEKPVSVATLVTLVKRLTAHGETPDFLAPQ